MKKQLLIMSMAALASTGVIAAIQDADNGSVSYAMDNSVAEASEMQSVKFDFTTNSYGLPKDNSTFATNGTKISVSADSPVAITLNGDQADAWRMWSDGLRGYKSKTPTMTIAGENVNITGVVITVAKTFGNNITINDESVAFEQNAKTYTWAGDAESLNISFPNLNANNAIASIEISYTEAGEPGKEKAGIAFSEAAYSVYQGDPVMGVDFKNPNNLPVTFASSNEKVATVDAATGVVTTLAPGETVISATSEETDTYAAGYASYTLTVVGAVSNIPDFEEMGRVDSTLEIVMNCDLGVVYQNSGYTYVVDAEGNAGLVYGKAVPAFEAGNTIKKGWIGKISVYNGLTEIVPVDAASLEASGEAWSGNLDALEITEDQIMDNINRKVYVKNIEFTADTPAEKTSFTGDDEEGNVVSFYNTFALEAHEAGVYNVIGFASINTYKGETTYRILPISFEEVVALPEVSAMMSGDELANGMDLHMQGAEQAEITFSVSEGASVVYSFIPANEESEKVENATLEGNTLTLTEAGELTFKAVKGELASEPVTVTISGFAAEIHNDVEVTDAEGKPIENNATVEAEKSYLLTFKYADTAELYYNFTAAPGSEVEGEEARRVISIDGVEYTKADANPFTFNVEKSGTLKYFAIDNEVYSEVKTINFDITTGVATIETENGEARYYDLNGREVKGNLEKGVYVRVLNGEASKMIVK